MDGFRIVVSWPPAVLSPNNRSHWAKKNKARQSQKEQATTETLRAFKCFSAWGFKGNDGNERPSFPVRIAFCPPDKRKRDLDNMLASMKGAIDGIAETMNIDDKFFHPQLVMWGPQVKGGRVIFDVVFSFPETDGEAGSKFPQNYSATCFQGLPELLPRP